MSKRTKTSKKQGAFKPRRSAAPSITPSLERAQWLEAGVEALRTKFAGVGYEIPTKVRTSIGWPKRAGSCGAIGECWSPGASSDKHAELFVSPVLTDGSRILDVLAHELAHATVGAEAGHRREFRDCALAVGLKGPMRATTASPEFNAWAKALFKQIGPYPAGFLTDRKAQGTRLMRCECETCGYLARVTNKWLAVAGPPVCPTDRVAMVFKEADKKTAGGK